MEGGNLLPIVGWTRILQYCSLKDYPLNCHKTVYIALKSQISMIVYCFNLFRTPSCLRGDFNQQPYLRRFGHWPGRAGLAVYPPL